MKENIFNILILAVIIMIYWGIEGIFKGAGFIGGISLQIDAIGQLIAYGIKLALIVGVLWGGYYVFLNGRNTNKKK